MIANRTVRVAALCVLGVALVPKQALASAFGFKAGMTKDQIIAALGKQALTKADGDTLIFSTAPSPHSSFDSYVCLISPQKGLLKVVAISSDVETNSFGEQLKDKFNEIEAGVSKAYGEGRSFDFLQDGSIWSESQDWMMGLLKKERTLMATWKITPAQDHITIILLEAKALSSDSGYVTLGYEFEGFDEFADSRKQKQDNVF